MVLFSGGVDSLTTALMLKKKKVLFGMMYGNLGHKYAREERGAIKKLVEYMSQQIHY